MPNDRMSDQKLNAIARAMVVDGKGILAADESLGSIEKKLVKIGVPSTQENRRAYRDIFINAPQLGEHISGVIMFDETFRDHGVSGELFVSTLTKGGVLSGIKVDEGTKDMEGSTAEKITKGLEGLPKRMPEYAALGAAFAKWRAVITIGSDLPTDENLRQSAKDLAAYAKVCQESGIVPIVEPEVLMDADNDQARCAEVTERTLTFVFEELGNAGVYIDGMILKPNMIVPGKLSGQTASPEQVAVATIGLFKKILPENLPGIAFLSGGQSEVDATKNLNAINKQGPLPWKVSFSYGRALQDSALKLWGGKPENVEAARTVFLHRAKMNGLAALGKYEEQMEA